MISLKMGVMDISIRSMTGFVQLNRIFDGIEYFAKLKSLNSKGLQLSVSIPRFLSSFEVHIIQNMRKRVERGRLEFKLNVVFPKDILKIKLNRGVLESYMPVLKEMAQIAGSEDSIPLDVIMNLENLFVMELNEEMVETIEKHLELIIEESFEILDTFKISEGEKLEKIIRENLDGLRKVVGLIKFERSGVKEEYRRKLEKLFEDVGKNIEELDRSRLEEEVLFLIERSDITEEIDRLEIHIDRFEKTLNEGGSVGSILDFLCQEMHRELNTIASKSRNANLIHLTVDGREIVKKLREQVQNIE